MRVLHIVKTTKGASWVYHQVRVLCSLGIEVVVVLPSDTDGFAPRYRDAGAKVLPANLDFPTRHPWRLMHVLRECRELVEHVRPDLIHSHHVGTTFVARLALGKRSPIPRVFQVQGPLHLEHRPFAAMDLLLAGARDYWIATCQWTRKKYLQLGIGGERVFLSYLGTDLSSFKGTRTGRLREELGIQPEVPLLGMVAYIYSPKWFLGQWQGVKGHEDFIAAIRMVKKFRPDVRAVIIGGAWGDCTGYENHLRLLGKRACDGYLTFLGTRNDVPAIYPDLDLTVVPSHSENVSGSSVEALLSGVPVVATNVGGLPDLIQERQTGWLTLPGKPEPLARTILSVLETPQEARRRTAEGQRIAKDMFDVERTAREVAMIYQKVLEPRRRLAQYA